MGRPLKHDLLGQTFGELIVLSRSSRKAPYPYWTCRCTCGQIVEVASSNLRFGHSRSCGCQTKELMSASLKGKNTTHGLTQDGVIPLEYNSWQGMMKRCYKKSHPYYKDYGGRGIKVCRRWRDFGAFFADMGPRPSPKHSLDRRDNSKGYNPSNCRWATAQQQLNNTRTNYSVMFNDKTQTLAEWAREVGLSPDTLRRRLKKWKWTTTRALTTPVIPPRLRRAHVHGPCSADSFPPSSGGTTGAS